MQFSENHVFLVDVLVIDPYNHSEDPFDHLFTKLRT